MRFSYEIIADYINSILLSIFKEQFGFHSLKTIRINFASWIKKAFNEKYFIKIANNNKILLQINHLLELNENNLF